MSEGAPPRREASTPGEVIAGDEATLHAAGTASGRGALSERRAAIAGDEATMLAQLTPGDDSLTLPRRTGSAEGEGPGRIGRYVVVSRLGEGGMGVVYAGYDPQLDRRVAVKLVRPVYGDASSGGDAQARLLREAQALARLRHPNVVQVYEAGAHGDQVFVAMEFVDGVTLRKWQFEHAGSWREVLRVYTAAGQGLAAAHRAGIIHRDFKPDNVLVTPAGEPRVLDFGLAFRQEQPTPRREGDSASALDTQVTMTGALVGTPAYMSPEQHRGESADARSDVFAFCVSLYEALYGVRPFGGQSLVEICANVFTCTITEPSAFVKVPKWLRRAVVRGLQVDPEARYRSMGELLDALGRDPARLVGWGVAAATVVVVVGLFVQALRSAEGEQVHLDLGARRRADFDARRIADLEGRLAEAERSSVARARDGLLLAQAEAAVADDPERALALLKHLSSGDAGWLPRARFVAFAAAQRLLPRRTIVGAGPAVRAVAFVAEGDHLVRGDAAGDVVVTRVGDGAEVGRVRLPAAPTAIAVARSGDDGAGTGPPLRVAAVTASGELALWEVATGGLRMSSEPGSRLRAVALDPRGETVVSGGDDGRVMVRRWGGELLHAYPNHRAPVLYLSFGSSSEDFASASEDGAVIVWSLRRNTRRELEALASAPRGLVFDGDAVVVPTAAGALRRWQVEDGHASWMEGLAGATSIRFATGGPEAAALGVDGGGWLDRGPGRARRSLARGGLSGVDMARSGERVALAFDSGEVEIVGALPAAERDFSLGGARPTALAWSHDGAHVAAATNDGRVHIFTPASGERRALEGSEPPIRVLSFGPRGDLLVAEGGRGSLARWRLTSGDEAPTIYRNVVDPSLVSRVVWSGPGELLRVASGGLAGLTAIDVTGPAEGASTFLGEVPGVGLDVSADGRWVVSFGEAEPPRIWERMGGLLREMPVVLPGEGWSGVASGFVDGGVRLAVLRRSDPAAAGVLAVWHVDLATRAAHLIFESGGVRDLRVDAARHALAWRDSGGALHLWELAVAPPRRLSGEIDRILGFAIASGVRRALVWGVSARTGGERALLVDLAGGGAVEVEPRADQWALAPSGAIAAASAAIGVVVLSDPVPAGAEEFRRWLVEATPRVVTPAW